MTTRRRRVASPDGGFIEPVIDAYKKGIDRTLLRENLKLTYGNDHD